MSLFDFIDFGDNSPTSASPSGIPKKATTSDKLKISDEVNSIIPKVDNSQTKTYLKEFFAKSEKVGKDLIMFENRKTIFGHKITASDKVREIGIINAHQVSPDNFISISFKLIVESEISNIVDKYMTMGLVRPYPLVVEIKYMTDPEYNDILLQIHDEFM